MVWVFDMCGVGVVWAVYNWKAALLSSFGRMMWLRRLHTQSLLGPRLAPVVAALATGVYLCDLCRCCPYLYDLYLTSIAVTFIAAHFIYVCAGRSSLSPRPLAFVVVNDIDVTAVGLATRIYHCALDHCLLAMTLTL